MTKNLDFVLTDRPVNGTAARMLSKGVHYEPQKEASRFHSEFPISTVPVPKQPGFIDLTGVTFGRMKVVGYVGRFMNGNRGMWLVRCACGRYETRSSHAIKNPQREDSCTYCDYLDLIKTDFARLRKLGLKIDERT